MEIRRLTEGDAEALWRFRLHALESDPAAFGEAPAEHRQSTVAQTAARLRNGGEANMVFGAFEGAALIGMVGLYRVERIKRSHKAGIWGMFVDRNHRGTGAGRLLLDAAIRAARAMPGLRSVNLSVITGNQAARRLYLNAGFRPYGLEPESLQVDGQYYEEEHMALDLLAGPDLLAH
jgi:RimJ/RimL family protein N-acetyltransferase